MSLAYNDAAHRYRLDDQPVPNVTTIIRGGLPAPALIRWAPGVVAEYVADHLADVVAMRAGGREPTVEFLRALPDEARNVAAVRGTQVHALAEDVVHGREVDVPAALLPRVQGYARWLDLWDVRPLLTEAPCANREVWYAGRFDLLAKIGESTWLLDVKTARGVYGDSSLQLGAYASAEFYVADDEEHPLPHVDRIGVVHVTDDGTDIYEMGTVADGLREFRAAKVIYEGNTRRRRLGEHPLTVATAGGLW